MISDESRNQTLISVDNQIHIDYGLAYPITYEFYIPMGNTGLKSFRRFQVNQDWILMEEKTENDFSMKSLL